MTHAPRTLADSPFFGWRVVYAAFVVAFFGWGMGLFGPPVFLQAIHENRGWSVELVSIALTAHYLMGAFVVGNLPRLYQRFGLPFVTAAGAILLTIGLLGWAAAAEPWQLFLATVLSGAGWAAMGGAAINALIAPWFARLRPRALSWAYNGASIGGFLFSPLWVFLITRVGFFSAVLAVGAVAIVTGLLSFSIHFQPFAGNHGSAHRRRPRRDCGAGIDDFERPAARYGSMAGLEIPHISPGNVAWPVCPDWCTFPIVFDIRTGSGRSHGRRRSRPRQPAFRGSASCHRLTAPSKCRPTHRCNAELRRAEDFLRVASR